MICADLALSQKLERTEARANAAFVEARARQEPQSGATWIEVAGAYAMFDAVDSPLTQTFGLGIFEGARPEHLEEIETFFRDRGSATFHEISPMIDPTLMALLSDRGYRPIELTSVMYRAIDNNSDLPSYSGDQITTRRIDESENHIWSDTIAAGWASEGEVLADFIRAFGNIAAQAAGSHPFIAEIDGLPVAAGGFQMYDDVCILAGASTIAEARRRGAQNALLAARLQYARENGCRFAMICALPGSQSQKNAQKNGFQIAYTRTKWHLPL